MKKMGHKFVGSFSRARHFLRLLNTMGADLCNVLSSFRRVKNDYLNINTSHLKLTTWLEKV